MIERPSYLRNRPISGIFLGEDWTLVSHTLSREQGKTVLGPAMSRSLRGNSDSAANIDLPKTGEYLEADLVIYLEPGTLDATPLETHEIYMERAGVRYRALVDDDDGGGAVRLACKKSR